MDSRRTLLSSVSCLALLLAASTLAGGVAQAADLGGPDIIYDRAEPRGNLPAVSGVNVKAGAFGTSIDGDGAGGAFAAIAFPLSHGFGAQIDGVVGGGNGPFYGVGGHLFWRDPSRGLLGAYTSYLRWDNDSVSGGFNVGGAEVGKVGLESQIYLGRMSLEGLGAYQFGTEKGFAGKAVVAYYPHDDLRLHLGVSQLEGPGFSTFAGIEWAPSSNRAMSVFGEVGINEDHDTRALAGVKFYFAGQDKSLIRRHREDDPDIDLPADLFQTTKGACPVGQKLINGFCDGNT